MMVADKSIRNRRPGSVCRALDLAKNWIHMNRSENDLRSCEAT